MASKSHSRSKPLADQPMTVSFVSLGCPKNLVDSEKMLGQLAEHGAIPTADEDDADVIVINTCGFLEASKQESLEHIRQAVARKEAGLARRVVVAGCLATRMGRELLDAVPGIDAIVGVNQRDEILQAVGVGPQRPAAADVQVHLGKYHPFVQIDTGRLRLTPRHYAYLRVSEGCSQGCSFCTIPSIRGPLRSKPVEAIEAEARELIADGALELNLIGQDTTSYGADIGFAGGLAELVRRLDRLDGACWIRLLYAYPSCFTDEMIDALAAAEHFVPYVDMPLQHINDRLLKRMKRKVTRAQTEQLLGRLRERIPGLSLRTTFITGFPGETEAEHRELLEFVRDFAFDMLGVFCYSQEKSTPAGRMADQVAADVKQRRQAELMAAQQEVVLRRNRSLVGTETQVLVDRIAGPDLLVGRTPGQAPEVDSLTWLAKARGLKPGQLRPARIVGFEDYDLIAAPAGRPLAETTESADLLLPIYQPIGVASAAGPDPDDQT
ncbi:MAG: Ribosomal protein S12 methylthiotransferase RimO [Phycisphaerae bacterium]|nr:Ribosomal protein S12 methylthiotransferase RimO [Phycisphaerae bacterium]